MFDNGNIRANGNDADQDRNAYNLAFCELGLEWFWDSSIYTELQTIPEPAGRISSYVEKHRPHLLSVYDSNFLANAIESTRAQFIRRPA